MPLRTDFTSGPSQQQENHHDPDPAGGERVDNSLVQLYDAHQRGVILVEEDEPDVISLERLVNGLGIDAAASLFRYITRLRNNQRRPQQVSSEEATNRISAMFREMFPLCISYEIAVAEGFRTDGMAVQSRFVANIRAERGDGNEAVSQGFRGATYEEALQNLLQGISDIYRVWTDFPPEEGEDARSAFLQEPW